MITSFESIVVCRVWGTLPTATGLSRMRKTKTMPTSSNMLGGMNQRFQTKTTFTPTNPRWVSVVVYDRFSASDANTRNRAIRRPGDKITSTKEEEKTATNGTGPAVVTQAGRLKACVQQMTFQGWKRRRRRSTSNNSSSSSRSHSCWLRKVIYPAFVIRIQLKQSGESSVGNGTAYMSLPYFRTYLRTNFPVVANFCIVEVSSYLSVFKIHFWT